MPMEEAPPVSLTDRLPARFGRYILLDRLSTGGMGEVFRAKLAAEGQFQRLVAVKCMLPRLLKSQAAVDMFLDEARLAALLTHSNLLHIYELGYHGEILYIAMELVTGQDLRRVLRTARQRNLKLPTQLLAYVLGQTAAGLDFAHRALDSQGRPLNLVHRDITPANILVSYAGEVKLGDFGVVKARGRTQRTQPGVLKGKCAYMAPEQVKYGLVDPRSDIFAMGAVFYEMLTGQRLFTGEDDEAILNRIAAGDLPDLRAALPVDTDPRVHAILQHALAINPMQRYQQASELKEDLDSLLLWDNTVFSNTHATEWMTQLFKDEMDAWPEKLRAYGNIGARQCVVEIGGEPPVDPPGPHTNPARAPPPPLPRHRRSWMFNALVWLGKTTATLGIGLLLRMAMVAMVVGGLAGLVHSAARLEPGARPPTLAGSMRWVLDRAQAALATEDGKHGYVTFTRRPGHLRIDGRDMGRISGGPRRLSAGVHRFEIVDPAGTAQLLEVEVLPSHSRQAPLLVY